MSKQPPTPDKMINELSGSSAFFKRSTPTRSDTTPAAGSGQAAANQPPTTTVPPSPVAAASPAPSSETQVQPVRPGRDGRPQRRIMIRHPFEIYADQLEGLRELSDRLRREGENGSMSKMVRDAIDRLIDEHDA